MKEQIITEFVILCKQYRAETGAPDITRRWYLEHSKFGKAYDKYLSFTELKKFAPPIEKPQEVKAALYLVSCIVAGQEVDKKFINCLLRYCKDNGASLILIPVKGVNGERIFSDDIMRDYGQYIKGGQFLNKNLAILDINLTANNIPLSRLQKIGHKGYSLIVGSPKQRLEVVPSQKTDKVHLLYSTGTVSDIKFRENITGRINQDTYKKGAIVAQILSDKLFLVRNIQYKRGYFVDLGRAYHYDKVCKKNAAALVLGDLHIGDHDEKAVIAAKEQIAELKPAKVILHDVFNHATINPHRRASIMEGMEIARNGSFKTLEEEHNYCKAFLGGFLIPRVKYYAIKSNHDEWLEKYLEDRNTWIRDTQNTEYCLKLIQSGADPLKHIVKDFRKSLTILDRNDSLKVAGYELAVHGDRGNSGRRGTFAQCENSLGLCVVGHYHTPKLGDVGVAVGTLTRRDLSYIEGTGNDWLHANAAIYNNGTVQMIITIGGEWK